MVLRSILGDKLEEEAVDASSRKCVQWQPLVLMVLSLLVQLQYHQTIRNLDTTEMHENGEV
jgi:hypothetical protein